MKRYVVREFGGWDSLAVEEAPDLVPADNEIVVDVRAIGLNFPDLLLIAGKYQKLPERPFTPGMEFSGVVRATGAGVSGFAPGDRVIAQPGKGGFGQQAIALPNQTFRLSDKMDFSTASAMGLAYQSAYIALFERAHFSPGENVLVGGANGGVGYAAVQIAKAAGGRVIACVRSSEAAAIVREAGADCVIDVSGPDMRDGLKQAVLDATQGHGADVVIDPIGGEFFQAAVRAMAWSARLVVVGFASGEIAQLKTNYLLLKNISVCGMQWTDYRDYKPESVQAAHRQMNAWWEAGQLDPKVEATFDFEELPQALKLLEKRSPSGRVVVTV